MSEETRQPQPEQEPRASKHRVPEWAWVVALIVAVAFGALVVTRVAAPLYGLLFPLRAPLPDDVQEVKHGKSERGEMEYWIYRTSQEGRAVAQFYEQQGSVCRYSARPIEIREGVPYNVAYCYGHADDAVRSVAWEVFIAEGYPADEGPTIFRLYAYDRVPESREGQP